MRNWPIRYKITLVLLLPLLALVGFGSWVVSGQLAAQQASEQTRTAARFLIHVNDLVYALQTERYAVSSLVGSGYRERDFAVRSMNARGPVDGAFATVTAAAGELPAGPRNQVRDAVTAARGQMGGLATVRAGVDAQTLRPGPGTVTYNQMISGWLDVGAAMVGIGSEDTELVRVATALSAISRVGEAISQQYGYVSSAAVLGTAVPDSVTRVQAATGSETAWLTQFRLSATADQAALYDRLVGPTQAPVTDLRDRVLRGERIDFTAWASASGAKSEQIRAVQRRVVEDLENRSGNLAEAALRQAILSGLLAAGVLALSIAVSVGVASRLVGALRTLRAGALDVAQSRLPAITSRLRQGHPVDLAAEPPAFATATGDEIGDVARAFNVTYSSAITAAYEVAEGRSVGAILQTLARRTQGLIQRQLRLIDELERDQQDGEILTRLFGVDHQATRMRRLAESLIVLSGGQPGRTFRGPVRLVQVLRAAVSEVEDYTRVHVHLPTSDVEIVATAVGDLTHMLAELIENACAFSPPDTPVTVQASRVGQGWTVEIEDRGVGLDDETYAATNDRMANPPPFEASTHGSQIGLFVVARLAARHRIAVRFKPSVYGGVHVVTIIPAALIHTEVPHQNALLPAGRAAMPGGPDAPGRRMAELGSGPGTGPGTGFTSNGAGGEGVGIGAGGRAGMRGMHAPTEELALTGAAGTAPHHLGSHAEDTYGGRPDSPDGRPDGYGGRSDSRGGRPDDADGRHDEYRNGYGGQPDGPASRDGQAGHDGYAGQGRNGYGGGESYGGGDGYPGRGGYAGPDGYPGRFDGTGADPQAGATAQRGGDGARVAGGYGEAARTGGYGDAGGVGDRFADDSRHIRLNRDLDAAPPRRADGRVPGLAAHGTTDLADNGMFDPLFGPLRGTDGAASTAPAGAGGHPRLEDLPRRRRGSHLAESLRDDPGGAPAEPAARRVARTPDPEAARALAQGFTSAFERGMRDADDLDGR
ncbi:histidine kinase [Parafrankia colletiae]|uniref:histidine kinase n=1 Tax=Parafrankia colletiae TaxID=573497 RepID=A0A1S1Q7X4_9ACTN|nr:nitrate- and nitrite sensing domain-containing protein [Parafrankia colletiae]MCK9904094.1 nitrate- and nitrite sensing domain-containing protein [Frankia sp. Cpl3]OHV29192.1 histidine kinase [Parafrankia colletiae]